MNYIFSSICKKSEQRKDHYNDYYFFPNVDEEFKNEAYEDKMVYVLIFQNKKLIDEFTINVDTLWKSDVSTQIRTTTRNGIDISKRYSNAEIIAFPSRHKTMFNIETFFDNEPNHISIKNINKQVETYISKLKNSKNIIFHGAPGTGKTFLAYQIATNFVSNGEKLDYDELTEDEKQQIQFVQFHPSYDYTDFVEGLRPITIDNSMGFELQDGIFKAFIDKARKNHENSNKTIETLREEKLKDDIINKFLEDSILNNVQFETTRKNQFTIVDYDEDYIYLLIPANTTQNKKIKLSEINQLVKSKQEFTSANDVTKYFNRLHSAQSDSYLYPLWRSIIKMDNCSIEPDIKKEKEKSYVFIIDEINRGEISKIFGELFFSIDPGYRGTSGSVSTQYSNLHVDPNYKFYIPENVYIIGTMNDIDRSVETFDFAMRRRFRFIEITAKDSQKMLETVQDKDNIIKRMNALNNVIAETDDLNEHYQIGAAYFLKLEKLDYDYKTLWLDFLKPLLQEYVQGMPNSDECMKKFEKAYNIEESNAN